MFGKMLTFNRIILIIALIFISAYHDTYHDVAI